MTYGIMDRVVDRARREIQAVEDNRVFDAIMKEVTVMLKTQWKKMTKPQLLKELEKLHTESEATYRKQVRLKNEADGMTYEAEKREKDIRRSLEKMGEEYRRLEAELQRERRIVDALTKAR